MLILGYRTLLQSCLEVKRNIVARKPHSCTWYKRYGIYSVPFRCIIGGSGGLHASSWRPAPHATRQLTAASRPDNRVSSARVLPVVAGAVTGAVTGAAAAAAALGLSDVCPTPPD